MTMEQHTEIYAIELIDDDWVVHGGCKHIEIWSFTDKERGCWQAILDALCDHEDGFCATQAGLQ